MIQLDVAGCRTSHVAQTTGPQYYLAEVCRSVRVHTTSLAVENNVHIYGPPYGQLLVVAEGHASAQGEEVDVATAIDSLARQLLRDDSWLMSLTQESWRELEADLKAVLTDAPAVTTSANAESSSGEEPVLEPRLSLTAAFVSWPRVTIVQVGNSTSYLCRGDGAVPLTDLHEPNQVLPNDRDRPDASQPPMIFPFQRVSSEAQHTHSSLLVNGWHGELDSDDTLVLCTSSVPQNLSTSQLAKAASSKHGQAAISAKRIEQAVRNVSSNSATSVVVAKLGTIDNENLVATTSTAAEMSESAKPSKSLATPS